MSEALPAYAGTGNLEVMAAARNYNAFLTRLILDAAPPRARILDFGAGTGTFASRVAAAGHELACVEPDPALRARLAAAGFAAHATAEEAPAGFDLAYTLNVLEHIDDDAGALAGLYRLLRPGGRLVVYVPAFAVLFTSMDRRVGHLRRYRRRPLMRLIERAGFTVERAAYCDSLGFLATLLYKLVPGDDGQIDRGALVLYDRFLFPVSRCLDAVTGRAFGKNVAVLARKP